MRWNYQSPTNWTSCLQTSKKSKVQADLSHFDITYGPLPIDLTRPSIKKAIPEHTFLDVEDTQTIISKMYRNNEIRCQSLSFAAAGSLVTRQQPLFSSLLSVYWSEIEKNVIWSGKGCVNIRNGNSEPKRWRTKGSITQIQRWWAICSFRFEAANWLAEVDHKRWAVLIYTTMWSGWNAVKAHKSDRSYGMEWAENSTRELSPEFSYALTKALQSTWFWRPK